MWRSCALLGSAVAHRDEDVQDRPFEEVGILVAQSLQEFRRNLGVQSGYVVLDRLQRVSPRIVRPTHVSMTQDRYMKRKGVHQEVADLMDRAVDVNDDSNAESRKNTP